MPASVRIQIGQMMIEKSNDRGYDDAARLVNALVDVIAAADSQHLSRRGESVASLLILRLGGKLRCDDKEAQDTPPQAGQGR